MPEKIPSRLPAFGLVAHSEQIDTAALEARAWSLNTVLLSGRVLTAILPTPDSDTIRVIEAIAAKHLEHHKTCTDPTCVARTTAVFVQLCPNGKFDLAMQVFHTCAFDNSERAIPELRGVATTPEQALKNHYSACTLLAGAHTGQLGAA